MSISLSIENEQKNEIFIPISTELFFNRCWKNVAQKHNLKYILSMQTGFDLDRTAVQHLISEMKEISTYILSEDFEKDDMEFFVERLNFLILKLENFLLNNEGSISGWVG